MPSHDLENWSNQNAFVVDEFDASALLCAPFKVILKNSVSQIFDENGEAIETIIPDPDGLVQAVAQYRVLHEQKLSGLDLKFLRSALKMKAKDFAEQIGVTAQHMSRLEAGSKALTPNTEKFVRILTFVSTLDATTIKNANASEIAKFVGGFFNGLKVKPCRSISDELVISVFHEPTQDGLWSNEDATLAA